jgi:hypothetical protein
LVPKKLSSRDSALQEERIMPGVIPTVQVSLLLLDAPIMDATDVPWYFEPEAGSWLMSHEAPALN